MTDLQNQARRLAEAVAHAREVLTELHSRVIRGEDIDTGLIDAVIAMYHDQGLIPVKTLDMWGGVNVTLGLPYLRTSVDHGTAFAIAGSGRADAGPMNAVVETTLKLLSGELPRRRRVRED